jgi:hypothetical protein
MQRRVATLRSRIGLVLASFVVHALTAYLGLNLQGMTPFNDVNLYTDWAARGLATNVWPGVSEPGVYPMLSLVPMAIVEIFSSADPILGWLVLVTVLNTGVIWWLSESKSGRHAGAYWLVFIALLGPIAIGRIDSIAVVVDLVAVGLVAMSKYRAAAGLAVAAAWVKVWPAAQYLALLIAQKTVDLRIKLLGVAAAVSLGVVGLAVFANGNENIFSFLWINSNRGLQIESPIANIWMWGAKLGWGDSSVYFDSNIITFQVTGPFANTVASLMTLTLIVALAITAFLGWRATKAGAAPHEVFALVGMTAVLDLIVFNKVGSPQFHTWLAAPLIAGILLGVQRWRLPLYFGLALAALTAWIYPYNYDSIVNLDGFALVVLTLRNLLLIAFLVWANVRLGALSSRATR